MDYGIGIPSYIDAWREVKAAEEAGFTHAWFYDSQLIYSDVWATMALAAHHTSKIQLGTLVAIPSNRIAPVTAAAAASINKIAPGRVILGLGTGYTGRNTMGLPALTMKEFAEYTAQVKGLLAGEDVLFREGERERWIRLMHSKANSGRDEFFNIEDPIPVMLAANGPRGQKLVGELGDGWITTGRSAGVPKGLPRVSASAEAAGNSFDHAGGQGTKPYVTVLTSSCVLREGETLLSERVIRNVGPTLVPGVHAMWEGAYGPGANLGMEDADLAGEFDQYIRQYGDQKSPPTPDDRRYLDAHEGHYVYLKQGEEQFVSPELMARSLTGTGDDINRRLDEMEAIGIDNVALSAVDRWAAQELIADFSEEVIKRR
ncbi:MAG: LLM class flavin-dependent oxidoreductase [SAR202 cluster bacterium]|jgi:alkanesulfonate monooxygenase SsuD/methylene tetrahydromethanopterin reductase-like flavin-dependent oxidoreductase (luciferase family)|nr:LLM class flavin-dependent oxidoreductase [SAR202 cluster bacterium]MDP6301996.1 LLM class flavin-dependent oxidoreductase [SAR202 cluster bacterium]MDP7103385.1 LLM class flavin-dependent oxidoreductase [SAR202 cluster bacterium]MDP7223751.1 LLM class flavin-dependent oxidoreductase [SAR202 cluster bacterium]MDP7415009.1 LLM class flavin-dependent oxidoreductase [SAR202 cluster bacterium]|tara:strand:- start:2237 stop:3355 length:1119 start_codon:yes stop_codon:yes gene_type:complete